MSISQEETLVEPDSLPDARSNWGRYTVVLLGSMLMLGVIGWNLYGVCQLKQAEFEEKEAELLRLRQAVYAAEFSNAQLKARVAHLKTDAGVEEIAREKLGLLAPGEVSFVVVPPAPKDETPEVTVPPLPAPPVSAYQRFLHTVFIAAKP